MDVRGSRRVRVALGSTAWSNIGAKASVPALSSGGFHSIVAMTSSQLGITSTF
jgi:hypothetical protein